MCVGASKCVCTQTPSHACVRFPVCVGGIHLSQHLPQNVSVQMLRHQAKERLFCFICQDKKTLCCRKEGIGC